jgi:putative ABC transport system permease protein
VGQARVAENFGKHVMIVFAGRTSLQAGGTRAGRRVQWTAADPRAIREAGALLQPRAAGAGAERPGAQRAQRRHAPRDRLQPGLRLRAHDPGGQGRYPGWATSGRRGGWRSSAATRRSSCSAAGPRWGRRSRIGDFPYTVIGVMQHKEQDSSYDGRDINKVFVPFSAMMRDLPQPPPSLPGLHRPPHRRAAHAGDHEACKASCAARWRASTASTRATRKRPTSGTRWRTRAFRTMTDGMKYFLGAVGIATLFIGGIGT